MAFLVLTAEKRKSWKKEPRSRESKAVCLKINCRYQFIYKSKYIGRNYKLTVISINVPTKLTVVISTPVDNFS